jgi:hypothetical protein
VTLNRRDAALRADAVVAILTAGIRLDAGRRHGGAFRHAIYNHPRAALRSIASAEAYLAKAKHALRAWARRPK